MGSPPYRTPRSKSPARSVLDRKLSSSSSNSDSAVILTPPPSSVGTGCSGSSVAVPTPPASARTGYSGSVRTSCSGSRGVARPRSQSQSSDPDSEKIPPSMWQGQILPPKLRQEPEPETRVRDWFDKVPEEPPSITTKIVDRAEDNGSGHNDKGKRQHDKNKQQHVRNKRFLPSIPEDPHRFPERGDNNEVILVFNGYLLLSAMILVFLSPFFIPGTAWPRSPPPPTATPGASGAPQPLNQLTVYVPAGVHCKFNPTPSPRKI